MDHYLDNMAAINKDNHQGENKWSPTVDSLKDNNTNTISWNFVVFISIFVFMPFFWSFFFVFFPSILQSIFFSLFPSLYIIFLYCHIAKNCFFSFSQLLYFFFSCLFFCFISFLSSSISLSSSFFFNLFRFVFPPFFSHPSSLIFHDFLFIRFL